jgi:uncharacterized protein YjbI with pentapeptide repeats
MAEKIDAFDVAALERSLNDSAVRVSTIWVSFLIFALYLVIAAATVDHLQLLLAAPLKLPVLNIDLPLWGFFFLAPIMFVIFHAYVLLQVLLLGRTAAAYNDAVEHVGLSPTEDASLRQRLANTLFAQIFAGSPRERAGFIGGLLSGMAWITLAITPILVLLIVEFRFLPYHSHVVAWTHRLLILGELAAVFLVWPLVLNPRRDFEWAEVRRWFNRIVIPLELFGPKQRRQLGWHGLRQRAFPLVTCLLVVIVSWSLATFPGEPHVNLLTGHAWSSVQCEGWIHQQFRGRNLLFDRLFLWRVDVVDDEKLATLARTISERQLAPWLGGRTQDFRDRDLNCAVMVDADLRFVFLDRAQLQGASFQRAQLQGASLFEAQLQGAVLMEAQLHGANLQKAQLQLADLERTELQGAHLGGAQLQGAVLAGAQLQGALLDGAQLQGAVLAGAQLQGALLDRTRLQGALLAGAQLQGALLDRTQLQGSDFEGADLTLASIANSFLWRASNAKCDVARVIQPNFDAVIEFTLDTNGASESIAATPETINEFINRVTANLPAGSHNDVVQRLRSRFVTEPRDEIAAIAKVWSDCAATAAKIPQVEFDRSHAALLRDLVCDATEARKALTEEVIRSWILERPDHLQFSTHLARNLLGEDGKDCAAISDLNERYKETLRKFASSLVPAPKNWPPTKQ